MLVPVWFWDSLNDLVNRKHRIELKEIEIIAFGKIRNEYYYQATTGKAVVIPIEQYNDIYKAYGRGISGRLNHFDNGYEYTFFTPLRVTLINDAMQIEATPTPSQPYGKGLPKPQKT